MRASLVLVGGLLFAGACGGDDDPTSDLAFAEPDLSGALDLSGSTSDQARPAACNGSVASTFEAGPAPTNADGLVLPAGYVMQKIASVYLARELAALPNGDLLVGTSAGDVFLVPNAEAAGAAGKPVLFKTVGDSPAAGVTFDPQSCTIFVGTQHGVHAIPYKDGDVAASSITQIASVRESSSGGHITTSVAVRDGVVYASVGSTCNACTESDPTRATIQQMTLTGADMKAKAKRFRNAIALAIQTDTGTMFAGGAGQDALPDGHPYEPFDGVTAHAGEVDYGWPDCEENHNPYGSGKDCSATMAPIAVVPAYSTVIGATFYAAAQTGAYAFRPEHRSGFFLAGHGAWHMTSGGYFTAPRVAFLKMNGDAPVTPVDWADPTKQWSEFVGGYQLADGVTRIGRPTGIAVGAQGSLFIADDQNGAVYRVRPQ